MSGGPTEPPPYMIPVEGQGGGVKVYHVHTPFTPPPSQDELSATQVTPVYSTKGGGVPASGVDEEAGRNKYVSYETDLGRSPGMTSCASCQKQVMTDVTYKAGTYAWLMCLLFICCGLVLCCCLIPFFMKNFKDAYHTCPHCNRILHVDKKKCCS